MNESSFRDRLELESQPCEPAMGIITANNGEQGKLKDYQKEPRRRPSKVKNVIHKTWVIPEEKFKWASVGCAEPIDSSGI